MFCGQDTNYNFVARMRELVFRGQEVIFYGQQIAYSWLQNIISRLLYINSIVWARNKPNKITVLPPECYPGKRERLL